MSSLERRNNSQLAPDESWQNSGGDSSNESGPSQLILPELDSAQEQQPTPTETINKIKLNPFGPVCKWLSPRKWSTKAGDIVSRIKRVFFDPVKEDDRTRFKKEFWKETEKSHGQLEPVDAYKYNEHRSTNRVAELISKFDDLYQRQWQSIENEITKLSSLLEKATEPAESKRIQKDLAALNHLKGKIAWRKGSVTVYAHNYLKLDNYHSGDELPVNWEKSCDHEDRLNFIALIELMMRQIEDLVAQPDGLEAPTQVLPTTYAENPQPDSTELLAAQSQPTANKEWWRRFTAKSLKTVAVVMLLGSVMLAIDSSKNKSFHDTNDNDVTASTTITPPTTEVQTSDSTPEPTPPPAVKEKPTAEDSVSTPPMTAAATKENSSNSKENPTVTANSGTVTVEIEDEVRNDAGAQTNQENSAKNNNKSSETDNKQDENNDTGFWLEYMREQPSETEGAEAGGTSSSEESSSSEAEQSSTIEIKDYLNNQAALMEQVEAIKTKLNQDQQELLRFLEAFNGNRNQLENIRGYLSLSSEDILTDEQLNLVLSCVNPEFATQYPEELGTLLNVANGQAFRKVTHKEVDELRSAIDSYLISEGNQFLQNLIGRVRG